MHKTENPCSKSEIVREIFGRFFSIFVAFQVEIGHSQHDFCIFRIFRAGIGISDVSDSLPVFSDLFACFLADFLHHFRARECRMTHDSAADFFRPMRATNRKKIARMIDKFALRMP